MIRTTQREPALWLNALELKLSHCLGQNQFWKRERPSPTGAALQLAQDGAAGGVLGRLFIRILSRLQPAAQRTVPPLRGSINFSHLTAGLRPRLTSCRRIAAGSTADCLVRFADTFPAATQSPTGEKSPSHHPRVCSRSFSSMAPTARPFISPVTCSLTSASTLGSS